MHLVENSGDAEAQRFAALALGNVAASEDNRIPIAEEGVIPPLCAVVLNPDRPLAGR